MAEDTTYANLTDLITAVNAHKGSWGKSVRIEDKENNSVEFLRDDAVLSWEVIKFIWESYNPDGEPKYTPVRDWAELLTLTIDKNGYNRLTKDQVLSILIGLHHRNRIVDGLWVGMLNEGVTQKLLARLLVVDTD